LQAHPEPVENLVNLISSMIFLAMMKDLNLQQVSLVEILKI